MANGPTSSGSGNLWERPWTIEELREHSSNWNLAGDAGLLLLLQDFAQRLISRTHDLEKQVDSLVHETKSTDTRIHNVINDFLMLSNSQFVENRVYDEEIQDETPVEEKKPEPEKTKEQKESELIPKITDALRLGIAVIDNAFEKLDMKGSNSDSDEDDATITQDPLLEPKDPYLHRPLPHIIGTAEFLKDDDVGLTEVYSDDEAAESDRGSESPSESEDEKKGIKDATSEESESDSDFSDEKSPQPVKRKTTKIIERKESGSDSDGSDLFGTETYKKDEESDDELPSTTKKPFENFANELSSKLNLLPKQSQVEDNEDTDDTDVINIKKKKKEDIKKEEKKSHSRSIISNQSTKEPDLFGASESPEEDSPFQKKGLFFSGGGLFDDDREEQGGLFDTDIDDHKPRKKTMSKSQEEPQTEIEEKLKEPKTLSTKSGKKLPAGAVSVMGDVQQNIFERKPTVREEPEEVESSSKTIKSSGGLFGDDDDTFDDLFSRATKSSTKSIKEPQAKLKAESLFASAEDDLFPGKAEIKTKKPAGSEKKMPAGAVSMFGGAPNPLMAALKAQKQLSPVDKEEETGTISDEESKNRSDSRSSKSSRSSTTTSNKSNEAKKESPSPSVSSNNLFIDEPEDDLFATPQQRKDSKIKSKPIGGISLFDNEDIGEDFFTSKSTTSTPSVQTPSNEESKRTKSNVGLLFEDEEDDLFTVASKSTERKKAGTSNTLFSGTDDLFETSGNVVTKKDEVSKPPEAHKILSRKSVSLFDDDDDKTADENLFMTAKKTDMQRKPTSPIEKKPRSKSRMLFEDEDILFGGEQPDSPNVDLFGTKSPLDSPTKETAKSQVLNEESKGKVPKPSSDLFNDNDNLFKVNKPDNPPFILSKPKTAKTPFSKTTPNVPSSSVLSSNKDDDLFSVAKKLEHKKADFRPTPARRSSIPLGPEKAVGGSETKTKEAILEDKNLQPKVMSSLQSDMTDGDRIHKKHIGGIAILSYPDISQKSPVLNGEPNLVESMSPLGSNTEQYPASFDSPADSQVLQNATKDRAKIQAKRRPQSRKARHEAARNSAVFDSSETAESDTSSSAGPVSPADNLISGIEDKLFVSKVNSDLFGQSKSPKETLADSLFGDIPPKTTAKENKAKLPVNDTLADCDDIFADIPLSKAKYPSKTPAKGLENSIFSDDIDDIFSEVPKQLTETKKKSLSTITKKKKKESSPTSFFDSDVPDIFDDPLNVSKH